MENLKENEMEILFESLGKTLQNQDKIINHLKLNKYNYDFLRTRMLSDECFGIAQKHQNYVERTREDDDNEEPMTNEEILEYLKSTGLYDSRTALSYVKDMLNDNKTIPIAELVERIVEIDKAFRNRPWNILQILTNINMIVPLEDRK